MRVWIVNMDEEEVGGLGRGWGRFRGGVFRNKEELG